jgi:hypothetical protein
MKTIKAITENAEVIIDLIKILLNSVAGAI